MGDSCSRICSPHWQQTMHALATRLLLAFSAMPAAKVCRLTGPSPAVWLHLSMITGGLTLRIVAGVASVCW
jgi:hypothetical protein